MPIEIQDPKDLLSDLPKQARRAYRFGQRWEFKPDIDEPRGRPVFCDRCQTWHKYFIERGIVIEDQQIYRTYHRIEADGNWKEEARAKWGSDHHKHLAEFYWGDRDTEGQWMEYFKWCSEYGEDPLGELDGRVSDTEEVRWRLHLIETEDGVRVVAGRRPRPPSDKIAQLQRPDNLPSDLKKFLMLPQMVIGPDASDLRADDPRHLVCAKKVGSISDLFDLIQEKETAEFVNPSFDREPTRFPNGEKPGAEFDCLVGPDEAPSFYFIDCFIEEPVPEERRKERYREAALDVIRHS